MQDEWPDPWVSGASKLAEQRDAGITNDYGTLYMVDGESFMWMSDIPAHLENRC